MLFLPEKPKGLITTHFPLHFLWSENEHLQDSTISWSLILLLPCKHWNERVCVQNSYKMCIAILYMCILIWTHKLCCEIYLFCFLMSFTDLLKRCICVCLLCFLLLEYTSLYLFTLFFLQSNSSTLAETTDIVQLNIFDSSLYCHFLDETEAWRVE